jgi:hypothetical protein
VAGHKEHVPWTESSSGLDVITSSGLFMAFLRASLRFRRSNSVHHSSRFFNRGEIEIGRAEYFPTSRGQILFWLAALITQYGGDRADRCETRGPCKSLRSAMPYRATSHKVTILFNRFVLAPKLGRTILLDASKAWSRRPLGGESRDLCYELRTKKTQQLSRRRIVVWWKGAPLRLRLCKTRPPHFVALQGRWGEFRGALKKRISRIYPRKTISH